MKPTNRIMCPDCGRPKMLFETERKANDFIRWNGDEIDTHGGQLRAYYCPSCCGWHISHHRYHESYEHRTDNLIGAYERTKRSMGKIDRAIRNASKNAPRNIEKEAADLYKEIPEQVKATRQQGPIKRYLTEYFVQKGMKDDGRVRQEVYRIFWHDMYERFNS